MYWIVFALFCFFETIADIFISFWLPFYYELKIVFVLWLLSPWTKGASILYRKWVHPTLSRHEKDIDLMLEQAKSESYNQVMRLGSRGLLCAREVIATAALRGQAQLAQHIQRSYSASDVSREPIQQKRIRVTEIQEEEEEEGVWEGVYNDEGSANEQHIQHAEDEGNDEASAPEVPRRSHRTTRQHRASPLDPSSEPIYNTIPRRSSRQHK